MNDQLVISMGPTGPVPEQDFDVTPTGTGEVLSIAGIPVWLIVVVTFAAVYAARKKGLIR